MVAGVSAERAQRIELRHIGKTDEQHGALSLNQCQPHSAVDIIAAVVFALASVTDALDGYLARSRSQETS